MNPFAQWRHVGRRGTPSRRGGAVFLPAVLALLIAPSPPPAAAAPSAPPPDSVSIEVVAANGRGCATADQVTAGMAPDDSSFTVTYHAFRAQSGAGTLPPDFRNNCQLTVRVSYPPEFTFAIVQNDLTGQARIAAGASATVRSGYYRDGAAPAQLASETMVGPREGDWRVTFQTAIGPIWEPCGQNRALRLATELRVPAGASDPAEGSFIELADDPDTPSATYHLVWQECSAPAR